MLSSAVAIKWLVLMCSRSLGKLNLSIAYFYITTHQLSSSFLIIMASSNVNIRLHGRWVEQFASQGFRLCTAFGIESGGKTHFDVVAAAYGMNTCLIAGYSRLIAL
jgi:hypothetical protein